MPSNAEGSEETSKVKMLWGIDGLGLSEARSGGTRVTQDDSDFPPVLGSGPRGLLDLPHFVWGEKTSKFRGKFLEGMCCFSNMLLLFLG